MKKAKQKQTNKQKQKQKIGDHITLVLYLHKKVIEAQPKLNERALGSKAATGSLLVTLLGG